MKLIIQVPCLNEAEHLPATLRELPRQVDGFDTVEWLVIDDGSTDATVEVARREGVDHLVRLTNNKGLASAFQAGLDAGLKLGADVIVNTDADGQYSAADIPLLVAPILKGEADMVVGDREVHNLTRFSARKKRLQRLGSWVVRRASGTGVPDTTSGFRAYNREAALQLQVVSKFSYTLESLIQAGKMLVAVTHVPIATAEEERRPSRLHQGNFNFVRRSASTILRIYATYEPLRVFTAMAILLFFAAFAAWSPFLIDMVRGRGTGHLQSIILGGVLMIAAVQVFAVGILADQIGHQRALTQRALERVRRIELHLGVAPSHYEPGNPPRAGLAGDEVLGSGVVADQS
ncbi:MAG TPA: glycosyltransferase family 2 protein [Acidimicrobiales bacterium]|nr:glycosyltransferase family 2 protein [Acidimicrobiales bacterium]